MAWPVPPDKFFPAYKALMTGVEDYDDGRLTKDALRTLIVQQIDSIWNAAVEDTAAREREISDGEEDEYYVEFEPDFDVSEDDDDDEG